MLEKDGIILRAIEKEDLPFLQAWRNDENLRKYFREWRDFSLTQKEKWYDQMIHASRLHQALMNSVKVGIIAAIFSTLIALLAAKAFTKYKVKLKQISYGAILLPFVIPEIIIAVSLIVLWTGMGLQLGLVPVTISHILFCTPFCRSN